MDTYPIYFLRENCRYDAEADMTLLAVQRAAGLAPDAPCGGRGTCGKCRVLVNGREALACQTLIDGAMTVDTMPSAATPPAAMPSMATLSAGMPSAAPQLLQQGIERPVPFSPGFLPEGTVHPLLAAVDLGSTSIVAYLLDGRTGAELGVQSALNPQRQYGADVVARASYAMEHGRTCLSECVRRAVNQLLATLAEDAGASPQDIVGVTMVGNCCMHHLFLELPVDSLVLAPYTPCVTESVERVAHTVGLDIHPQAPVRWLANIGGFVGADTTACLLAAAFDQRDKLTLLVDIGTNGEMALGTKDGFTVCSTAAGPAFEGARITCGMRGSKGAIDHVRLENGRLIPHVIGGGVPVGICGSGLLDAIYCLLRTGHIQDTGRMAEPYYFTPAVFITQKDVREVQLAKAAMAAGVELLCRERDVRTEDIQELLLAGAFGNYLNPASACGIGLLPVCLQSRVIPMGNAAGAGAKIAMRNREEFQRGCTLAQHARFLELALRPDFQEVYVDNMSFAME